MKYLLVWVRKNLEGGPRSKSNICWVIILYLLRLTLMFLFLFFNALMLLDVLLKQPSISAGKFPSK